MAFYKSSSGVADNSRGVGVQIGGLTQTHAALEKVAASLCKDKISARAGRNSPGEPILQSE
jgi:hypothetical protein